MNIKYGIPSYHRPECKTYKYLTSIGVNDKNIVIGLNDPSDYIKYRDNYPCANIIVNDGNYAAFNRNRLLDYIDGQCILLDDDITKIKINKPSKTSKYGKLYEISLEEMESLFIQMFEYSKMCDAKMFGVCATDNTMTMKSRLMTWGTYTPDVLIQGTVAGIVDKDIRFDERFMMVEDYELSCRIIKEGHHTIRRNDLCAIKPKNGTNAGGLHERYANGELVYWLNAVCKKYPFLKKNKEQTGAKILL